MEIALRDLGQVLDGQSRKRRRRDLLVELVVFIFGEENVECGDHRFYSQFHVYS
jgi:hypothetical protein